MKTTYTSLLLFLSLLSFGQFINIRNAYFKAYLPGNAAINTNVDTEIQLVEATSFTGTINCQGLNVSNLTGIILHN